MTEGKDSDGTQDSVDDENVEPGGSCSLEGKMGDNVVKEKGEENDVVAENGKTSKEKEIEEEEDEEEVKEDDEEKNGEAGVNDQIPNEDIQLKQAGSPNVDGKSHEEIPLEKTSDDEVDGVDASKDGNTKLHEEIPVHKTDDDTGQGEENKLKASIKKNVELHSDCPEPRKSVDDVKMNENMCMKKEQGEVNFDAISKGNIFVKCERDSDNGSAMHVKNLTEEVKHEENRKEPLGNRENVKDVPTDGTELNQTYMFADASGGGGSGTEEEQLQFMKELENFFKEKSLEFKPPKFYGEPVNLLKLWRAVTKLGGYDKVTACKLWRQVGESFNPPKTCTTVSWTFRVFYEKALVDYERHKIGGGELNVSASHAEPVSVENQAGNNSASGSGRARRDAAARAMQGWHSQRLLGNGEVSDPIIKDKSSISVKNREKHLKSIGGQKRKKPIVEAAIRSSHSKLTKVQSDSTVIDIGPAADWVKINVRTTKDCYEVYALVPGLLREELRVQSDPAGRLVISGEPENADNPWGVTPFKKVVTLPSRIDPHQTSAVVTLHGQLFVRVPFELPD